MTISEAISEIDALKPNTYTNEEKIRWLSRLDSRIQKEIIDTHEGGSEFSGYTSQTLTTTPLLVPAPYDELYIFWLESQIDYANGETKRFNNSSTMFNVAYQDYASYYNRTNTPKTVGVTYW